MHTPRKSALAMLLIAYAVPAWASGPTGVEALAWMAGSWDSQQDGAWVEEH